MRTGDITDDFTYDAACRDHERLKRHLGTIAFSRGQAIKIEEAGIPAGSDKLDEAHKQVSDTIDAYADALAAYEQGAA